MAATTASAGLASIVVFNNVNAARSPVIPAIILGTMTIIGPMAPTNKPTSSMSALVL